jgi:hypothetical protein
MHKFYKHLEYDARDEYDSKMFGLRDHDNDFKIVSYFGNSDTYSTLKKLLKIYIDGIILYLYKDEVITYSEFMDKYDKETEYYKNFLNRIESKLESRGIKKIYD